VKDTLVVTRINSIPSDSIRVSHDTISVENNSDYRYVWKLNGAVLPQDTSATIFASAPGDYLVIIVSRKGCGSSFATATITSTRPTLDSRFIMMAPNPAKDFTTISIPSGMGAFSATLYSNEGKFLGRFVSEGSTMVIPTAHLARGMYRVMIATQNAVGVKSLAVE
jgi:hypothetical protein